MYVIIFENEVYQQWCGDYVFSEYNQAKEYLKKNGFMEINRLFERREYNWSRYVKAYIKNLNLYA